MCRGRKGFEREGEGREKSVHQTTVVEKMIRKEGKGKRRVPVGLGGENGWRRVPVEGREE